MPHANTNQPASLERRRQYFVDRQVQGALLRQAVYYWFWASATFAMIVFVYRVFPALLSGNGQESGRIWYHLAPYMVASAVLLPIVMFSSIRFSSRFAGPMVRVRRTLKELARGDTTPMRSFRRNDFWSDTADDINEIAALLRQVRPATVAPNPEENLVSCGASDEALE
jgi:hypothetical protein